MHKGSAPIHQRSIPRSSAPDPCNAGSPKGTNEIHIRYKHTFRSASTCNTKQNAFCITHRHVARGVGPVLKAQNARELHHQTHLWARFFIVLHNSALSKGLEGVNRRLSMQK